MIKATDVLAGIYERRRDDLAKRAADLLDGFHPDPTLRSIDVKLLTLALTDAYLDGARDTFDATEAALAPLWRIAGLDP